MATIKELTVIGIGSSAGGLEALQVMLAKLKNIQNCAYIIAQHLSPTHKSMMVDLLSRVTNIPVVEVKNAMVIKPQTIYMTPENSDVYVANGKVYLKNIEQTFGPKPSVNYFFNSLATAYGTRAIGIILSGTGSDGAFGIRAIKASGGITIAQSPSSAKYDGMPVSAINTGKVDLVVPIDAIAQEVERIVSKLGKSVGDSLNESVMAQIHRIIFEEKGIDFSQYKKNTIIRRIERRLAATRIDTLEQYVDMLKGNDEEVSNLYNDILIGVTEFFRDRDVFEKAKEYLKELIAKKEQGEEIRIWSIGCSTGEEAYSLAILVSEILQEKISKYKIKIFATDIDDESLKIARAGIYAETSLINMHKDYVQRYFLVHKNHFEVKKSIRELVVFSKHNIISDSPFLRLDFISCRNMLIYFNQNLQNRFFHIAHYALKDNGFLMLGNSESIGQNSDLFVPVAKLEKIYKPQYTGTKELPRLYNYAGNYKSYEEPKTKSAKSTEEILEEKIIEATQAYLLNQCVVLNSSNEIIYVKGEIPYLIHAQGKATNNIFKSLKEELVLDLRGALMDAQKSNKTQKTPYCTIELFEGVVKYVRIMVIPIQNDVSEEWFYTLFFESESVQNIKGHIASDTENSHEIKKLSDELTRTKSHLQNVIEELETSYEEMQSLNEELSSSNEELQSSNEELETTNEELQSTNEELQTAYSELKVIYEDKEQRGKELEELTEKLKLQTEDLRKQKELSDAIINTTPDAIVMVNALGEISFVNKNAQELFSLSKKELLEKHYNSHSWEATDMDGNPTQEHLLPFAIIKKTFESIANQQLIITNGVGKKISVSINGSPLFDVKGEFMGAVFSIEDITLKVEHELIKKEQDIKFVKELTSGFEQLKSINIAQTINYQFNLVELGVMDIATSVKNGLGEISLLLQTFVHQSQQNPQNQKILQNMQNSIDALNILLGKNIHYYSELFLDKEKNFTLLLRKFLHLFSYTFAQNDIQIIEELDESVVAMCSPSKATLFLLELLSVIIKIKQSCCHEETLTLHVFYTNDDGRRAIVIEFMEKHFDPQITSHVGFEFCKQHFGELLGTTFEKLILKNGLDFILTLPHIEEE